MDDAGLVSILESIIYHFEQDGFLASNLHHITAYKTSWPISKFQHFHELTTDPVLINKMKNFIILIKDKINSLIPENSQNDARRPFGFISSSSEKTAEELLRQQRHSVNGASIEVQPAKPHSHEQQQLQMQQQYEYEEYRTRQHRHNTLISSISTPTIVHASMMTIHADENSSNAPTPNNNNYCGQIDQCSQGVNNGGSYSSTTNSANRNNNNSRPQWSARNNGGLSSMSDNRGVYGTSGNPASSSSLPSFYRQNQGQSMYNPNGLNQQGAYPHSNYPNHLRSPYGLLSSQPNENVYENHNLPLLPTISRNDNPSSSSPGNQYAPANPANDPNQTNYDPNMNYHRDNSNLLTPQYYPQQQPTASAVYTVEMVTQSTSIRFRTDVDCNAIYPMAGNT